MKLRTYLSAFLVIAAIPFSSMAQCNFSTDKNEPGFKFITQTVGPALLQWQLSTGKDAGKYYLSVRIVEDGVSKHVMGNNDHVLIDLNSGERLMFIPAGEVTPKIITTGKVSATNYYTRFEIGKDALQRVSVNDILKITAVLDGHDIDRDVKPAQALKIKEAATCVLK